MRGLKSGITGEAVIGTARPDAMEHVLSLTLATHAHVSIGKATIILASLRPDGTTDNGTGDAGLIKGLPAFRVGDVPTSSDHVPHLQAQTLQRR